MSSARTRVKLCGMQDPSDVQAAVAAGADAVGVINEITVESSREVSTSIAQRVLEATPLFVTGVLVTMPRTVGDARASLDQLNPDAIQIHGDLSRDETAEIAESYAVIRAFDVAESDAIVAHDGVVDALLIDSTDERGAGGTGHTHDWGRTRSYVEELETPVILAGGLTPENVGEAIDQVQPYGVDVASGIEGPSGKEPAAMAQFVASTGGV